MQYEIGLYSFDPVVIEFADQFYQANPVFQFLILQFHISVPESQILLFDFTYLVES